MGRGLPSDLYWGTPPTVPGWDLPLLAAGVASIAEG